MNLTELLKNYDNFAPVVPFDWQENSYVWLDFTAKNTDLFNVDLENTANFSKYVFSKIHEQGAKVGVGGYLEHRTIYRRSEYFQQQAEPRCIHLGIDIWAEAKTPVFAPLDGKVHSFANNNHFGDYGPTIILEHFIENQPFFTLYGHLSKTSLDGLFEGKIISKGEKIAHFGDFPENGDWPPHLHFQIMTTTLGMKGDFPGVCSLTDKEKFSTICPDPNLVLQIKL